MIIWLASYPKSGNTWIRIFLNSMLFSENKIDVNINSNSIDQFPLRSHFEDLTDNTNDINEFAKNCINAQDKINLDNKIKIFKTHNAYWKQNTTNFSFTNKDNTLGTIYIVRDPRNVITSVLNYFNKKDYDEALNFLKDENKILGGSDEDFGIPTIISSWSNHYNSWKKLDKNYLLIKYENLLIKPEIEFKKITDYLETIGKFKFKSNDISLAIESTKFNKLSSQEDQWGYNGNSPTNKKLNKKFFNLGPDNKWQKILNQEIRKKIEDIFGKEMRELGYL